MSTWTKCRRITRAVKVLAKKRPPNVAQTQSRNAQAKVSAAGLKKCVYLHPTKGWRVRSMMDRTTHARFLGLQVPVPGAAA